MVKSSKLADKLKSKKAAVKAAPPNVVVRAGAGCGKTTTIVEGLKLLYGQQPGITPSPEQQAVWDQILLSKSNPPPSVAFVAFSKAIATELQRRVPGQVKACTNHSLGFGAVIRAVQGVKMDEWKVSNLIVKALGFEDGRECRKKHGPLMTYLREMVGMCKMNLVGGEGESWPERIDNLTAEQMLPLHRHYDLDDDGVDVEQAFELVPKLLLECMNVEESKVLDFDDMIWLPVVLGLPVPKYDLLLIDELQDLNKCQQELVVLAGRRIIGVGDPNQAIFGFAGADSKSMSNMEDRLKAVVLPLMETRRCGKAIVVEANKQVPELRAHETNGPGLVRQSAYTVTTDKQQRDVKSTYLAELSPTRGDMVICRTNAPLVQQVFKLIKMKVKANIIGRDIARGLTTVLRKLETAGAGTVKSLIPAVEQWLEHETAKENARKNPSETKIQSLSDRADCLMCFLCQHGPDDYADQVCATIDSVFTEEKQGSGVRLSSIHRAKGLEAKRVYFLQPAGGECPLPFVKPDSWEYGQELNLWYTGVTRAIEELIWVRP